MGDGYQRVLTKYNWAKKHIDNLEAAVDVFRTENPDAIRRKIDDETREIVYYIASAPVIPDHLRLMLGDALHNLRSTLDHLACALASAADPTIDCRHTSFPIFDTPEEYKALSRSKIPGLRKPLYEVLDRAQPFKNGWGHNLWKLHRLDIVDKHRLLLSVATVPIANSRNPSQKTASSSDQVTVGTVPLYFKQLMFAHSAPRVIPMQTGCELGRLPISEENDYVGFAFDVAINEQDIVEGMPIFLFLRMLASEILTIINNFGMSL